MRISFLLIMVGFVTVLGACKRDGTRVSGPALPLPDGTPFAPICLMAGYERDGLHTYPLSNCENESLRARAEDSPPLDPSQFVSTAYVTLDPESEEEFPGFVGYRYFGSIDDRALILRIENGGGTGVFSTLSLYMITRDETGAQVLQETDALAMGDRCNGGVESASITPDGKISYKIHLTPFAMIALAKASPEASLGRLRAYEDLDDCAACCYALQVQSDTLYTGIELPANLGEALLQKSISDKPVQRCFDEFLIDQMQTGVTRYTVAEWTEAATQFEQRCLAP